MKELFRSKHIRPEAYKILLDKEFGAEWVSWEPETLRSEISRVFGVNVTEEVDNKISALRVLLTTPHFYVDASAFENIVLAMNDLFVDPNILQIASPEEIVYALKIIDPVSPHKQSFGKEIVAYVNVACKQVGLLKYPAELAFAQPAYTGDLAALIGKIEPKQADPGRIDQTDAVQVQSFKLYQIQEYVAAKMSMMNPASFEASSR